MKKKVSVILPVYNEKENIVELVTQVRTHTGKDLLEIIVVDDNSPDGTSIMVKKLQQKFKNLKLIVRKNESGLPSAIWAGIIKSKGNIVIWMDGDLSHPPEYIPKMLKLIPEYDVVCASRYVRGGKDKRAISRYIISKIINLAANTLLGLNVKDLTSGFYAVKREVFEKVKIMQIGFAEYCIRFTYESIKNGFSFKEVGYHSPDRAKGKSKTQQSYTQFLKNGYSLWKELFKLSLEK